MLRKKCNFRKPAPLMLITVLVSLSIFLTTAVDAKETFFSNQKLDDLINGNVMLTKVGHHGAGVHMFFKNPANEFMYKESASLNGGQHKPVADISLSLRVPW